MNAPPCHVCGAVTRARFDRVADPQSRDVFQIAGCTACGLGHTVPQPGDLGRYYGAQYHGGRHGFTAGICARRRLRLVQDAAGAPQGRRLLDVGCGDGTFLEVCRSAGWRVAGTEMNPTLARQRGLEVLESVEAARDLGPFACVTMWHTLEHFRDPCAVVQAIREVLAPGGVVLIAVPDAGGWQARLFGPHWFHLDVPRHLFHFNEPSLRKLLARAGLRVDRTWHQELEYDLMGWSQSALNALMPTPNAFFARLTGKPSRANRAEVAAQLILGATLSAAALPALALGTWLRRGGTLVASARIDAP